MAEVTDWRALSLLETEQPTLTEIAGGIGFTLGLRPAGDAKRRFYGLNLTKT